MKNSCTNNPKLNKLLPDLLVFLSILAIFAILAILVFRHQGSIVVDCLTQGAYIPEQVLKGKMLYKDILVPYGPLSYQINALLFSIFGVNLDVLYFTGIINTLVILALFYLIARNITSKFVTFAVSLLVITACIFSSHIFNYIFPYSYAMIYSLSTFLASVFFCLLYIKGSSSKFMLLSFFFMGISVQSKIDFVLFIGILAAIAIFLKPLSKKYILASIGAFLIMPVISWSILFLQGLTVSDLVKNGEFIYKMAKSPIIAQLYTEKFGLYLTDKNLILGLKYFKDFLIAFIPAMLIIYPVLSLLNNKFEHIIRFKFPKLIQIIAILIIISVYTAIIFTTFTDNNAFCWLGLASLLIPVIIMLPYAKSLKDKQSFNDLISRISLNEKLLIFLSITAITAAARSFSFISLKSFGSFLAPLLFLVITVLVVDFIPNYLKFLDRKIWNKSCLVIIISIAVIFGITNIHILKTLCTYPVITSKGIIYSSQRYASVIDYTIKYIQKEYPADISLIMLPQAGAALNFLSNRPANDLCYELQPFVIETIGEDVIIKELKTNPPDLILVNNLWPKMQFGKDYGVKISDFIEDNYILDKKAGKEFWIKIYKKNFKLPD